MRSFSHRFHPKVIKHARSWATAIVLFLFNSYVLAGEYTNFIGMKFVDIPAGSYLMGSCKVTKEMRKEDRKRVFLGLPPLAANCEIDSKNVNDNEIPQHTVSIRAFRMGATPVTLGQYKQYLAAIGVEDASTGWNLINDEFKRLNAYGDNAPVVQVSWHEAKEFIAWLNKTKPANDPHNYRLPTEAEWEYSCRAGQNHTYCGSNNVDEVGWVDRGKNLHQHDVATKKPNAWGLHDMTGNVWQWMEDTYHENYVGAPTDGTAWTAYTPKPESEEVASAATANDTARAMRVNTNFADEQKQYDKVAKARRGVQWKRDTTTSRVLRGGSWKFGPEFARSTYRLSGEPGNWYYGNGFRIAATVK